MNASFFKILSLLASMFTFLLLVLSEGYFIHNSLCLIALTCAFIVIHVLLVHFLHEIHFLDDTLRRLLRTASGQLSDVP